MQSEHTYQNYPVMAAVLEEPTCHHIKTTLDVKPMTARW
jgi:hypothetical protein